MNQPDKIPSLKWNIVLNVTKTLMSVIFPLITFPYVSKILGVENIGKYNFSKSIISYFLLLSGLGIETYAIREGSRIREKESDFRNFVSQIFTINLLSMFFAYLLLCVCFFCINEVKHYWIFILIFSFEIIFKTISLDWLYSICEDFFQITIRSIITQVVSLVLLFLFVQKKTDVYIYAVITEFSYGITAIYNFVYTRRKRNISITKDINITTHMRPILLLFAMAITITIYINSDITMLGVYCSDYIVGVYSVSVKVYSILRSLLSAIIITMIPRLSFLLNQPDNSEFKILSSKLYSILITLVLPAVVGIILLRRQIILIVSSEEYLRATSSLAILTIAVAFSIGSWFWANAILVPLKKEKIVFKSTIISAGINVVLNFLLIPIFEENGAAITSVISESFVFLYCRKYGKTFLEDNKIAEFLKVIIGCVGIVFVTFGISKLVNGLWIYTFTSIAASIVTYTLIEVLLKNKILTDFLISFQKKYFIK